MTKAIYPGSFDPVTLGHLNLVQRGAQIFDELIVCVASNPGKSPMFSLEERVELFQTAVEGIPTVRVETFDGLLVDAAKEHNAKVVLRGLRAVSDFDYEFQMAHMNHQLRPGIETMFMMTGEDYFYISSGLVKEVVKLGGDISRFVPAHVAKSLHQRVKERSGK
jgi:pantetheine-phosphate adenylyltransferase